MTKSGCSLVAYDAKLYMHAVCTRLCNPHHTTSPISAQDNSSHTYSVTFQENDHSQCSDREGTILRRKLFQPTTVSIAYFCFEFAQLQFIVLRIIYTFSSEEARCIRTGFSHADTCRHCSSRFMSLTWITSVLTFFCLWFTWCVFLTNPELFL